MSHVTTFVKEFPNGHQAFAVRTDAEVDPATVAEALGLPASSGLLLLSGGAGLMSKEILEQLSDLFTAVGEALAREQITVIDGGTQAGVMALMGEALAKAGRTAPYIGVLPAHAEVEPGGPRGEDILEPHHSHFVLIESDEWGSESKIMCDLATYLSAQAPSLVLLVNGGEIALQDIEWNVRQGREIVVLAGSGRLADEITEAVHQPERKTRDRIVAVVREGRLTLFDLSASPAELVELLRHRLKGETAMTSETEIADTTPRNPALEDAWRRFAIYDQNAIIAQKRFFRLRKWILALGVVATILALVHSTLESIEIPWVVQVNFYLNFLVIGTPILVSLLLAGSVKFERGVSWFLLRNSAEAIKKEIYRYRARVEIYSQEKQEKKDETEPREIKLARKVKTIGERLMKTQVNRTGLTPYEDKLPPQYGAAEDDDGFSDLDPEEYVAWRLENQLNWYQGKAIDLDKQLQRLQWLIYVLGGVGTFLAAVGLEIWIAVTTAMVGALTTFLEFKRVETTLTAYNQAATDLDSIRTWWHALPNEDKKDEKGQENLEKLVKNTEAVIQSEHAGWVQEMRDALAELYGEAEAPGEPPKS